MAGVQHRALKFAWFLLGIALPIASYVVWQRTGGFRCCSKKAHREDLQQQAVEDSFPASDPPASW